MTGVSFEQFAAGRLPALLRYAAVLTGNRALAEDVVAEVMAKAHVRWRRVSAADDPDAYVRRMVLNEYLSVRRRWATRHIRPAGDTITDLADAVGGQGHVRDHAQDVVDADDVRRRLATLPRRQRAVLVLRFYEQLGDREIADLLGCTPATVRSHASKALKALRLDAQPPSATPAYTPVDPRAVPRGEPREAL